MRPGDATEPLTIKVPGPFAGVADLGFSARYPEQHHQSRSRRGH